MAKSYKIDILNQKEIKALEKEVSDLKEKLNSKEFKEFLASKCMEELNKIMNQKLRTENYITEYRSNNKYRITDEGIEIYNNSMVDLSHVSPQTLANYPKGLSLSKLIEFGTGIPGTPNEEFEWETQVNKDRDYSKGWVYEKDGKIYWTKGQAGHFIYQDLRTNIEKNISMWIQEYIDSDDNSNSD